MENKLILHFDARNTLFVADFKKRLSIEKALNTYISGLVWGHEIDGKWEIGHPGVSITCPDNSYISFYKYMEVKMVKNTEDRLNLRDVLGSFIEKNKELEPIFLKHLKLMEWTYDDEKYFTVKSSGGKLYHYIIPTFFNTIRILHMRKRDFAIIIRSFGLEIPFIIDAINEFLNGKHPMYPEKLNLHLCSSPHKLNMDPSNNEYVYEFITCDSNESKTTRVETEIIEHWNSLQGIAAVKDDFDYWLKNNYHYSASKPLWINYHSQNTKKMCHHIFFDDCIHPRDSDSIVHLRQLEITDNDNCSANTHQNRSSVLNPTETEKYIDVNLVQSQLLECISNHDYFIEKIDLCEQKFAEMYL